MVNECLIGLNIFMKKNLIMDKREKNTAQIMIYYFIKKA